ncbi:MAG: hypothetical protein IJS68_01045 [Clostridia bacterium]|nr:hypothetical protein [Clostridia bacterium]
MASNSVSVIDIGSSMITVLMGERGINNTFKIKGRGYAEYAGFENGEFIEPESLKMAFAMAIANCEMSAGEKINEVYVGVPGEFTTVVSKECSVNFGKRKRITDVEINQLYSAGNSFKKHPTHTVINNSPIYFTTEDGRRVIDPRGQYGSMLGGMISYELAENNFLDYVDGILSGLGIKTSTYISSCLAECLHLFDPQLRDKYVLLVDCGYITTNVMLARGDGLLYLSNFSMGGAYITADLAECLKINFREAEALKHKTVITWKATPQDTYEVQSKEFVVPYSAQDTNQIVCDRLDMIIKYINKALENCIYDFPEYIPLYLTGGGVCYLKGIKDYFSKRIGRKVEIISPNLPNISRPDSSSEIGLLDVAIDVNEGYLNIISQY